MQEKNDSPERPFEEKGNSVSAPSMNNPVLHSQTSTAALLASIKGQSVTAPVPSFRKTGISQVIQEFQKILAQPASEIIARECKILISGNVLTYAEQDATLRFSNGNVIYRE